MAGMASFDIHLVLYGLFVLILATAGYYLGKMHSYPLTGAGIGAVVGVVLAGIIYYYTEGRRRGGVMAYAY
jgi:hypothetical protein